MNGISSSKVFEQFAFIHKWPFDVPVDSSQMIYRVAWAMDIVVAIENIQWGNRNKHDIDIGTVDDCCKSNRCPSKSTSTDDRNEVTKSSYFHS